MEVFDCIVHGLAPYASTALHLLLTGDRKQKNGLRGLLPVAVAVETDRQLKIKNHGLVWVRPWPFI
jgi:hypothetical protein